jgi:ubiquitin C-terminal hydrolase
MNLSEPIGLKNYNNTCYLNSVLQCLIYDTEYFKNKVFDLKKFIQDFIEANNNKFKVFRQNDSHEFFMNLLELNNEIDSLFTGTTLNSVKCNKCGNTSNISEEFRSIHLNIVDNIIDSFIEYLSKKVNSDLYNLYYCDHCKENVTSTSKIFLMNLPEHLLIINNNKHSILTINEQLIIKETKSGEIFNYSLTGIIFHYGTFDYGHYNNIIKFKNKWYFIDDQNVKLIDSVDNKMQNVYMLFYSR